jgi:radical SAM superfamily enzyme with C-terminal helix-hairpin-helix motif
MLVSILDGYVDEPSCLGVPPYISPYPRYLAGAIKDAGYGYTYMTIDEYRRGTEKANALQKAKMLVLIGGTVVPGKYLRGMPASLREILNICEDFARETLLGGPLAKYRGNDVNIQRQLNDAFTYISKKDVDTFVFDLLTTGLPIDRNRTQKEWDKWSKLGAEVVRQHPDFPQPLLAEIDTYRGCVRYFNGGCSFCVEPLFGEPEFRTPKSIVDEVAILNKLGVVNFRIGGQSCIFSYRAKNIGKTETPKPNVSDIEKVFKGIRKSAPSIKVLHTDNANPAVIAEHPEESRRIAKVIAKYCTSGNVVAFGMESADPKVIKENNLNATPEQVMKAIEIINEIGAKIGPSGLPIFLPGINILIGLKGESKDTFELNYQFLKSVIDKGLLIRRINIRQVINVRDTFHLKYHGEFLKFKEKVRTEIDSVLLKKIVPEGTIMRDVYLEVKIGKDTHGRQIGSYPLLVVLPYETTLNRFSDIMVTGHGFRSITGIEYPLDINKVSFGAIQALPDIGRKRASRIIRSRPFKNIKEFVSCSDDIEVAKKLLKYIMIT